MLLATALVVRMVNAGRAPDDVLRRAEGVAGRIFARAGVKIEWVDCRVAEVRSVDAVPGCNSWNSGRALPGTPWSCQETQGTR